MVNANPTYYKRKKLSGNRTAFLFDTLTDYNKFVVDVNAVATGNARRGLDRINQNYVRDKARESWFGTSDPTLVTDNITTYLFNNELDNFLQTLRSRTVNVDTVDIDQQKAIKFTEKEIGIFSFDLASLGLIRVYEFYSPVLKSVVSGNLVKGEKNSNGELIFFFVGTPEIVEHEVEYSAKEGGYYSKVLKRVVDKQEMVEVTEGNVIKFVYPSKDAVERHIVERRQVVDENGKKKFATTFKKCFIEIPKIDKPLPRIDIIIGSSFNYDINAKTQMIYSSMAAIALAEKLSKSGVTYRIIAAYPVTTTGSRSRKGVYAFVSVKKEGEALDKNKMAVLLSDGRQFRYQQFKAFFAMQYDAGYDSDISVTGVGSAIDNPTDIKNAYIDLLKSSDNPEDVKAAENVNSKLVFSGALSLNEATNQYNSIVSQISRMS
jgi:hypothetical protein